MSDTGSQDVQTDSRRKRKRTAQACGPCRSRKQKCDGAQPICAPCRDLGRSCSYALESQPVPAGKTVVDAGYLGDLEAMARLYRLGNAKTSLPDRSLDFAEHLPVQERDHDSLSQLDRGKTWAVPSDMGLDFGNDNSITSYPDFIPKVPDLSPFHDSGIAGVSVDLDHFAFDNGNPKSYDKAALSTSSSNVQRGSVSSTALDGDETADREMDGMGVLPNILSWSSRHQKYGSLPSTLTLSHVTGISPDFEYYGETSGVRFHAVLLDKLLPDYQTLIGCEDPTGQRRGSDWPRASFLGLPFEFDPGYRPYKISRTDLPSIQVSQRIWSIFNTEIHCLYPFISMETLRHSYVALLDALSKRDVEIGDPTYEPLLALHFSVFAIVKAVAPSQVEGVPGHVHTMALQLLRRNQDWPQGTIKVQALIHGVLLLQSVDCPNHSWILLGNAVRTAYSIGLHQSVNLLNLGTVDREIRCRAWWGCYTLDCLLSATLGRPSAITATDPHFSMPQPLWGEQPSSLLFFQESIRLYQALSELVTQPPNMIAPLRTDARTVEAALDATAKLEFAYAKWSDNLTSELQVSDAGHFNHPLAVALALRGMTMRLLLHRPVLLAQIREQVTTTSAGDQGRRERALAEKKRQHAVGISLGAIIETAVRSVHLLASTGVQLHPPWYQLFYAMNAFMSLVATFLFDLPKWSTFISSSSGDIVQSLHSIQKIIDHLSDRPASKRALSLVRQVLRALRVDESPGGEIVMPTIDGLGTLDNLPQLAFEDLYQLLDLSTGQRANEMPTSDWLGMFGSSG